MTVEALWADIGRNFAVWKGVGHFERKFQGERSVPYQRFLAPEKQSPWAIVWWKKIAEKFNRLSRVHQRHRRQTDRQTTDGIAIAYIKRNVIRWRLLKITHDVFSSSSPDGGTWAKLLLTIAGLLLLITVHRCVRYFWQYSEYNLQITLLKIYVNYIGQLLLANGARNSI